MKQQGIQNLTPAGTTGSLPAPAVRGKFNLRPDYFALLAVAFLLTVFQIVLVYLLTAKYNSDLASDFNIFLKFARNVLDGQSPYLPYQPTAGDFQGDLRFIYLYWVLFVYVPIARLPTDIAFALWDTFNLLMLFAAVWFGWRTFLPKWHFSWLLPLYCLALAAGSSAIAKGHVTVIMLLGISASLYLYRRGKYFAAGLPVPVVLMKPQITFMVGLAVLALAVYQIARARSFNLKYRVWLPLQKWLAGAVVSTLAVTLISLVIEPEWPFWLAGAFNTNQINGQVQPDGTYMEFYKSIFPSWLEFFGLTQPWIALISIPAMAGLAAWGIYRLWQWRENFPVFVAVGLALNMALTFYSHVYNYPPLLLPLLVIVGQIGRDWQAGRMKPAMLRLGFLVLLFVLQPVSPDYRWFYTQPLVISLLVLSITPEAPETDADNHRQPA